MIPLRLSSSQLPGMRKSLPLLTPPARFRLVVCLQNGYNGVATRFAVPPLPPGGIEHPLNYSTTFYL